MQNYYINFCFLVVSGDFITSLLRLTTYHDSRNLRMNIYLFCKLLFHENCFTNPVSALQRVVLGETFMMYDKVSVLWLSTL